MLRVSLRNLLTSKLRLFLTVTAVTVGVAFVSGTFVLSDTMNKAFDELYAGLTSGTDVVVKAETAYELDVTTGAMPKPLDDGLIEQVRAIDGVEVADGSVGGYALVLDAKGEPIQPGGAPTLGVNVDLDPALSGDFSLRDGRIPEGPDEVALDAGTADKGGFEIGDRVDVLVQGGRESFTLVGIMGFGETDSLLGATLAGWDLPTSQRMLGKTGLVDEIDLKAAEGVSAAELRDRVAAALPDGFEVITGEQVAEEGTASVRDALGIFTTVLLVFAGVSLFVGSFVIWNTFNVLVAQRRREVALLRAVGATRRQVLVGVLMEAAVIGLVAGLLGLLAGLGLAAGIRALLKVAGIEIPTTTPAVEPRTIVAALAVGVVITMLAAVAPAWSATRVAPMEALRDAEPAGGGVSALRRRAGWVLVIGGTAGLLVCAYVGNVRWWTVLATLVTFFGLVTAGPTLARGTAWLTDRGRRGGGWALASRNVARSARRSAATALALTIGLTVVVAVAVAAASMKDSVAEAVNKGNRADLILQSAGVGFGMSPEVAEVVRARDDVSTVVRLRETPARVEGNDTWVVGLDTAGLTDVLDLGIEAGDVADLGPGRILLGEQRADSLGVGVGDEVTVAFPETGEKTFEVVATFSGGFLINASHVMTLEDLSANVTAPLDATVLVDKAPEADAAATKKAVEEALEAFPNVEVQDPEDLTADTQASVDQLLGLVTALLLLAVIVAVLGIVNTLVLSVVERTRELGLMRAVGATRRQVRTIVRRESVLMSSLGAVTGLGLGVLAGVALSRALENEGISTVTVPVTMLLVYLVVAVSIGVVAAIGPARRASRVDVLQAITTE